MSAASERSEDHGLGYGRLVRSSLVGTLIALVFDFVVSFLTSTNGVFSAERIPSYVAFGIVGFAGGWLFELFKAQTEVTSDAVSTLGEVRDAVNHLTRRMTYQDEALSMLIDAPRHSEALTALIKASMADNFRYIPYVGLPMYLHLLRPAIEHADSYEGIHRAPFRWFRETEAGHYLNGLRDKPMRVKTRLVLIEDDDLAAMQADLDDHEVMDYYWRHTGDVQTYWMTVSEFRKVFPKLAVPRDMALYDRQLWVAYDDTSQTLAFDVVSSSSDEAQLFDDLRDLAERGVPEVKRVSAPAR